MVHYPIHEGVIPRNYKLSVSLNKYHVIFHGKHCSLTDKEIEAIKLETNK